MPKPGGLGRHPHPETPLARGAYPITAHPDYAVTTATYRYWYEGTLRLDQGQTGTCVGNALAHRYADGPVTHAGIDEVWAQRLYLDAIAPSTDLQEGTSALAACRVMKARGEISAYHWVTTADELRTAVLGLGSVCVGVDWYPSMDYPFIGGDGKYWLRVNTAAPARGGHEFLLNGINVGRTTPFYRMLNSWGPTWADGGTAHVACADLEDLIFNHNGDAVLVGEL